MSVKTIKTLLVWLAGVALFMPLIVLSSSFIFPFIVPKILFFRCMVGGVLVCYTLLLISDWRAYRPQLTWQVCAVGLFFLSFALSTFVGVDTYRSMWDNHERMLGLFTLLHYGAFFFVLSSSAVEKKDWTVLSRVLLVSGFLTMVVAAIQKTVGPGVLLNNGGDRVIATLGNPIYVSGYGLFLWLFGAYWYMKENTNIWARRLAATTSIFGFLGIFFGGTRGTLLALISVCGVFCIALLLQKHSHRLRRIGALLIGAAVVCGALIGAFRTTSIVQSIPGVNRLVETSLNDAMNSPRFMAWEVAVESFKDYPVFGWGPNNFYYAFNQYYRPEFLRSGYGETWFDNAHNIVVNTLATQGIFGLLVYLSVFLFFGSSLFIRFSRSQTGKEAVQWALLFAFLVGHFVHNVFVFENPTSYLYFFFFLAFIVYLLRQSDTTASIRLSQTSVHGGLCIGVALVGLLVVFATNINPARANMSTLNLIREVNRGGDLIALFDVATKYPTPHIDDLRNDFGRTALSYAQAVGDTNKQKAAAVLDRAIDEAVQNTVIHPLDVRTFLLLSELYNKRESIVRDGTSLPRSFAALERAYQLSPNRQQVIFALASLYQIVGDSERAIELYTKARDLDPTIAEGWWRLGYAYAFSGKSEGARLVVQEAKNQNINLGEYEDFIETTIRGNERK